MRMSLGHLWRSGSWRGAAGRGEGVVGCGGSLVDHGVLVTCGVVLGLLAGTVSHSRADETSAGDKLRILYSSRLTFTDGGLPLITVEIMSGQKQATLAAAGGLVVRPDGEGGSSLSASVNEWTVSVERGEPAQIQEWTVVETFGAEDDAGIAAAMERWKKRGFAPQTFDVGSVFGVGGAVMDTRETRVVIDPVPRGQGASRAKRHAETWNVPTSVHAELLRRPSGIIVAKNGAITIRNPSVLWFESADAARTISVADVEVGGGGSQLTTTRETRRYWGQIYATLDRDGKLLIANAVPEDKLLAGLVPAEMFPDAPDEALAAQAIAARTELLEKAGRRNVVDPFLLCSTQACQVYAGAGKEHPRTTRAVQRTRGMVLLRQGGGLLDVRYSASCGGHGEDNDAIWGGEPDPSLRARTDTERPSRSPITEGDLSAFLDNTTGSWCSRPSTGRQNYRWTATVAASDIRARLVDDPGPIISLAVAKRSASGRAQELIIAGQQQRVQVSGELVIRRLLGGLKSSLIEIAPEGPADSPTAFWIRGAGFGHGVGMCQIGAIGMAEAGKTFQQILRHYYPGTEAKRMY